MAAKHVHIGSTAGHALAEGVDVAADLVATTLGPAGCAVLVGREFAPPLLLRAGYAIVQQLDLEDHGQQMGVQAMRELAWRTSDLVGDGTSTAIVMARALLRAGAKAVIAGVPPAELQDLVDSHCRAVVASLEAAAVPVSTTEQLRRVATQAAGSDPIIGALIADAHERTGPDGVVQIEEGHGSRDDIQYEAGLHFDQGWISPHFVDDQADQSVELDDPLIVLHLGPVNDLAPLVSILEMIAKANRSLLVIAENVGGDALTTLIVNKQRAGLKVAAVKAPGAGQWRQLMLDDIAIATGGVAIGSHLGTSLEHLRPQMAGRAQKVRITRVGTTIVGGRGDPSMVDIRIREIRDAIVREKHLSFDRDQHRRRLARMEAGIATVRMGGSTSTEITERHGRAKTASAATRAAQQGGVLPGGSAALVHAGRRAAPSLPDSLAGRMVGQMFDAALQAPLHAIIDNAGLEARAILHRLVTGPDDSCFDVMTRSLTRIDALDDPLPVLRTALVNSVSTASRLLGLGAVITLDAA